MDPIGAGDPVDSGAAVVVVEVDPPARSGAARLVGEGVEAREGDGEAAVDDPERPDTGVGSGAFASTRVVEDESGCDPDADPLGTAERGWRESAPGSVCRLSRRAASGRHMKYGPGFSVCSPFAAIEPPVSTT